MKIREAIGFELNLGHEIPSFEIEILNLDMASFPKIHLLAASLVILILSAAASPALTVTFYEDDNCKLIRSSPFQGVSNPLVAPLNVCTIALKVHNRRSIV
jgi:hypothetical protein